MTAATLEDHIPIRQKAVAKVERRVIALPIPQYNRLRTLADRLNLSFPDTIETVLNYLEYEKV